MIKSILTASLLVSGALAQYGYSYSQYTTPVEVMTTSCTDMAESTMTMMPDNAYASSTSSAAPMVHSIVVGGDAGLVYTPDYISAAVGDIVEFHFMKENHTATQSSFDTPCIKLVGGMDSGFMPNINNTVYPPPVFKYTVVSMAPTWWYCKQKVGTHCGKGMTFAINPTAEKTYDEFRSMAIAQNGTTSTMASVAAASTVTMIAGTSTTDAAQSVSTWVTGNGESSGSSCECQCFCGVAAYPSGYGINNFGGMPGYLPAPWATTSVSAAAVATSAAAQSGGYYKR